ncbi:unnamed protein product [Closterium sp. Naga37s-1]|nr:unnamed protein product [Closterium sp. Naga37s-1]
MSLNISCTSFVQCRDCGFAKRFHDCNFFFSHLPFSLHPPSPSLSLWTDSRHCSGSNRLRITCNAASPGSQPAEDPYQVLGVRPLDSFDAIKVAHRKKLRDAEGKGDEAEIERVSMGGEGGGGGGVGG